MKVFIISAIMLMTSAIYSQDVIQVVGLKTAKAKDVATAIKGFGDEDNAVKGFDEDKDKDKHKKPSATDKMAEAMFKRIDVDKNGSLSIKEFKAFYAKIRSRGRSSSRGPQTGRPDRGGPQTGRPDRGGPQRGPKRDGLGGPSRGGLKGGPQRGPKGGRGGSDK